MKNLWLQFVTWFIREKWRIRWFRSSTIVIPPEIKINVPDIKIEQIKPLPREILYEGAKMWLGKDITPEDSTPDEYDCAETVNQIHRVIFGDEIGGTVSTDNMYHCLLQRKDFIQIEFPLQGDIIISPTGHGNGRLKNGHVGIVGENGYILSNNSSTGKLEEYYTLSTWKDRYVTLGGFPMKFFRKV